jgi:phosphomannomutase
MCIQKEVNKMGNHLEELLLKGIEANTPEQIKADKVFDYTDAGKFTFSLTSELVEKLKLRSWFAAYEKEAQVSTAGIRGPQNILYPQDTRFPINTIGVTLATLAKALVLNEKYPDKKLVKLCASEVRYNSKIYLDIISRIQAAQGIVTLTPVGKQTIPIWLASFLAFKLDLVGAEYITSSHGISIKNATKDLNDQGSQFLPNESLEFVAKIKEILDTAEREGEYKIEFSAADDANIDQNTMAKLNNGVDLYVEYLRDGVADDDNIAIIKKCDKKIIIDNVGGSAYNTLSKILVALGIEAQFSWLNTEEDPFFHNIGKCEVEGKLYDWSLDVTVVAKNAQGQDYFPVIESLGYDEKLKNAPVGTVSLITDPDHDRLNVVQIEDAKNADAAKAAGVDYVDLQDGRILCVFSANQAFLMMMDFHARQMKKKGVFDNHKRFMVKTTASSKSWDEWAQNNGVAVINTPVGFKEIANVLKKIEAQIEEGTKDCVVEDVFGHQVHLGSSPRMLFGGEESGGMIMGSEGMIVSKWGRKALAMREKSASEAIIVASALISSLGDTPLWKYLGDIYLQNDIKAKFDVREDISYYNESEADIEKLKASKVLGEAKRTKNDLFYLALAIAVSEGKMSLENARDVLVKTFPSLDFTNLTAVKFVGDGTYLDFTDKFVEIRPSGTDAKTKSYAGGKNKAELLVWAKTLGNYEGDLNEEYKKYLSQEYVDGSKEKSMALYQVFADKGADFKKFEVKDYGALLS